jgi:tetratricopeptide (TPR) repeat protein
LVIDKLVPDLDNLRGALQWAADSDGDHRIAIALFGSAVAGHGYFFYASLKAQHWIEMLRPLVDASIPASDAARFWLACAGWGSIHSPVAAIDDAKRAITLYRDLDDRLGGCRGWSVLTYSLMATGRLDEARGALDETLRLCDPAWPPWHKALVDNLASLVFFNLGELTEARSRALAVLAASRSDVDENTALSLLIDVDVAAGNVREAAAAASELLARHPAIWKKTEDGRVLRIAATALMSADRLDEAEPVYREALSRARRNYGSGALVLYEVAMFVALRGRVDDAARVFAYAERVHAIQGVRPRLVARQIRDRLLALLTAERSPDSLSQLYDEGRRLTDDEACTLAFPPLAR